MKTEKKTGLVADVLDWVGLVLAEVVEASDPPDQETEKDRLLAKYRGKVQHQQRSLRELNQRIHWVIIKNAEVVGLLRANQRRLEDKVTELQTAGTKLVKERQDNGAWARFFTEHLEWATSVGFDGQSLAKTVGHLVDEAREARVAQECGYRAELRLELADVIMVACHAAKQADVDLLEACKEKLAINRARKWELRDGGYRHVREEGEQ